MQVSFDMCVLRFNEHFVCLEIHGVGYFWLLWVSDLSAFASPDPQVSADWLEKEVALARSRENASTASKRSSAPANMGGGDSFSAGSVRGVGMLPREVIMQLKSAQSSVSASANASVAASPYGSSCTTANPSAANSRTTSRRPSFSSILPSANPMHDKHASTSSTTSYSSSGERRSVEGETEQG
jgi:hypothetical protein